MISEFVKNYFKSVRHGQIYISEAEFGLRYLEKEIAKLSSASAVLEIGSGPCILLNEISTRFSNLYIQGVEPMSNGFHFFSDFQKIISQRNPLLKVHLGGYESFESTRKWDLIFLVNVFEHLPDWHHFLVTIKELLAENGKCIILCPNYAFPYESHFGIPIIINKKITQIIFRKKIHNFEEIQNCSGLWESLNFVTFSQVKKTLQMLELQVFFNTTIIEDMVNRLSVDKEFGYRQRLLKWPALLLKKSRMLAILLRIPFFQKLSPYMLLEISKVKV